MDLHLPVDASHMRLNNMTVRVYNGSPKQVISDNDLELVIGPKPF
jgi:hypothetical protein